MTSLAGTLPAVLPFGGRSGSAGEVYARTMVDAGESDEELMARTGRGDRLAYARLLDRHLARTHAVARRFLADPAEAEDVAQEVFLRVWTQAPRWSPDGARLTTWLYRITMNLCIDRKRKVVPLPLEAAGEPEDARPGAFEQRHQGEVQAHLARALAALPENQRAAVVLSYFEGLGNGETAAILNTTVGAVESLLVRARRTLRERLGPLLVGVLEEGS
ncbi:RNA polymerase sigma factor [Stella sp.]|uniref:RNA polymerase sigma factor n=1 Tax=Stella sp. TaxID=2912054 RepID=UPI0035AEA87E